MKLGIIGTGLIVNDFLPELVKMEGLEIVSVMGSPAGFAKAEALTTLFTSLFPITFTSCIAKKHWRAARMSL